MGKFNVKSLRISVPICDVINFTYGLVHNFTHHNPNHSKKNSRRYKMANKVSQSDGDFERLERNEISAITRYVNLFYCLLPVMSFVPFEVIIVCFWFEEFVLLLVVLDQFEKACPVCSVIEL